MKAGQRNDDVLTMTVMTTIGAVPQGKLADCTVLQLWCSSNITTYYLNSESGLLAAAIIRLDLSPVTG